MQSAAIIIKQTNKTYTRWHFEETLDLAFQTVTAICSILSPDVIFFFSPVLQTLTFKKRFCCLFVFIE